MSKGSNNLKRKDQSDNSDASLCLDSNRTNEIKVEIFDIAKLLAQIAVDDFFKEKKT